MHDLTLLLYCIRTLLLHRKPAQPLWFSKYSLWYKQNALRNVFAILPSLKNYIEILYKVILSTTTFTLNIHNNNMLWKLVFSRLCECVMNLSTSLFSKSVNNKKDIFVSKKSHYYSLLNIAWILCRLGIEVSRDVLMINSEYINNM